MMMKTIIILNSFLGVSLFICLYQLSLPKLTGDMVTGDQQRFSLEFPNMKNPCYKQMQKNSHVEDILCMERPEFLSNYKNPCWREEKRIRCLPYFHIIGVSKSASTDLYKRLTKHPNVIENGGLYGKETWYWSWRRYGFKFTRRMTFEDYVDHFNSTEIERNHLDGYHSFITGQGDPMDFTDFHWNYRLPQNDPDAEELKWTTPYLVKHMNANIRLILSLRDPVEMLYSYYLFGKKGESSKEFHTDVQNSMDVWYNCTQHHSHRHCLYDLNVREKMKVRLYGNFYSSHLKEWFKVFPRQQFFIFRTEDYKKDIGGTLQQVFDFLNLTPLSPQSMNLITKLPQTLVTEKKAKAGPMLQETKELLVKLYQNSTIELAELLDDERYAFKDVSFG